MLRLLCTLTSFNSGLNNNKSYPGGVCWATTVTPPGYATDNDRTEQKKSVNNQAGITPHPHISSHRPWGRGCAAGLITGNAPYRLCYWSPDGVTIKQRRQQRQKVLYITPFGSASTGCTAPCHRLTCLDVS